MIKEVDQRAVVEGAIRNAVGFGVEQTVNLSVRHEVLGVVRDGVTWRVRQALTGERSPRG